MKKFFTPKPVYIGKRKLLPDFLPDMTQEDNIIVFLSGDVKGMSPAKWVDEHINIPLRPRTEREKKSGRFK